MDRERLASNVQRSLDKLAAGPEREVREIVGACRSLAKALAENRPDLLPELKLELHSLLLKWANRLDGAGAPRQLQASGSEENKS